MTSRNLARAVPPRWSEPEPSRRLVMVAEELLAQLRAAGPSRERRQCEALDLLAWSQRFLPKHFQRPPSRMHAWLAAELGRMSLARGAKLNLLGPRGSAKSTVATLAYVLRVAVDGREPYIWLVSDTRTQAQTHLENIKAELEGNAELAHAYPAAVGRGPRWQAGAIELNNGVTIESYGTGQRLRGRRRRENRPTLIVCDDLENDGHVLSATQRAASFAWFHGVLLKAGDARTNIVNLGTALHREALAMRLHAAPGWNSRLFRAVERWPDEVDLWRRWEELYCDRDDPVARDSARAYFNLHQSAMLAGAEVLWPENEDLYSLMAMRVDGGRTAFEREKQNSPIDPERCEWPEDYLGEHIWFRDWPARLEVRTIALDPSKGADARHGDYSAFVLLGIDAAGTVYVEADLARRPTPQMIADGVALCRRFRPDALGVEANQFQELLAAEFAAEFRRRKHRLNAPYAITNHTNKLVRIRKLGPLLAQHRLRFHAKSASTRLLVDQLRDFPLGAHDDGPDALEMALRLANELMQGTQDDGLGDRLIAA